MVIVFSKKTKSLLLKLSKLVFFFDYVKFKKNTDIVKLEFIHDKTIKNKKKQKLKKQL